MTNPLPSWRPGPTRDRILAFLDGVEDIPVAERVAYVDNDGTMWCEKPSYVQLDFYVDALEHRVIDEPDLADRPELAAVLSGDMAAIGEIGLAKVAGALAALFDGQTPDVFGAAVDDFLDRYRHRTLGVGLQGIIYQPMLELLDELRTRDFTIGIVTGGGTEFVRQVSKRYYGIEPGMVVGTLIGYRFDRDRAGKPVVRRTMTQIGTANEGGAKIEHIQSQVGRTPILAVGNSGGDREMLEWAQASRHGGLAVLVDHDDAAREFAYASEAVTFKEDEPITTVADRPGWVVVSMKDDWEAVFSAGSSGPGSRCFGHRRLGLRVRHLELVLGSRLTGTNGFQLGGDGSAQQQGDRREHRPQEQRHEAGERSVGVTEGPTGAEERTEGDGDDEPGDDGDGGTECHPRLLRLMPARASAEQHGDGDAAEDEAQRPADDVPRDVERPVVDLVADRVPEGDEHERRRGDRPGGDHQQQAEPVLAEERPVLLDPVDAVEPALELTHRRGPRDERTEQADHQRQHPTVDPGRPGLFDGGRHHLAGRPGDGALDGRHDAAAEAGVAEYRRQPDERDHSLHQDQRCHQPERTGVAEAVRDAQALHRVLHQADPSDPLDRRHGVVARELPGLRDDCGRAHASLVGTHTTMAAGSTVILSRLTSGRSPPSNS
jgi:phosphoglycolate phosphatase-like HAD superfamily hydrolase